MSEPGHIETLTVTASADPALFSNFANMAAVFDFFGGSQGGQPSEEDDPVEEGGLIIEVDPDTETLISSSEFQRLNQILKAEIFKDPQLMAAFASFISQGGFFTVTNASSAPFHRGPPPHIDLPQTMLTPSNSMLSDSLFKLTHEIYHLIHRTMPDGLVTKE